MLSKIQEAFFNLVCCFKASGQCPEYNARKGRNNCSAQREFESKFFYFSSVFSNGMFNKFDYCCSNYECWTRDFLFLNLKIKVSFPRELIEPLTHAIFLMWYYEALYYIWVTPRNSKTRYLFSLFWFDSYICWETTSPKVQSSQLPTSSSSTILDSDFDLAAHAKMQSMRHKDEDRSTLC